MKEQANDAVQGERSTTARQALRELLRGACLDARALSQQASLSEREVYAHLEHLERSLPHHGERLEITPSRCLACGYRFSERGRASRPSRCPKCKAERLSLPQFKIVPAKSR